MRCWTYPLLLVACFLAMGGNRAAAIGWDSDDFLIGGGPSFTTRIGVFDHDLTFKGYLDSSFVTVAGLDFDHAGQLVAVGSNSPGQKVRVYDARGALVGGFTRNDDLLGTANDLKVLQSGNYMVATQNFGGGDGAREFTVAGNFARQFGSGRITAVAVVPNNAVWIGGIGTGPIQVFDTVSGLQTGTVSLPASNSVNSMAYSAASNTVLVATIGNSAIELDLAGNVLHSFVAPSNIGISALTRGPGNHVFATASNQTVLEWLADGQFVGSTSTSAVLGGAGGIVWAGNAPEPTGAVLAFMAGTLFLSTRARAAQ